MMKQLWSNSLNNVKCYCQEKRIWKLGDPEYPLVIKPKTFVLVISNTQLEKLPKAIGKDTQEPICTYHVLCSHRWTHPLPPSPEPAIIYLPLSVLEGCPVDGGTLRSHHPAHQIQEPGTQRLKAGAC